MGLNIGTSGELTNMMIGDILVVKIYDGDELVWVNPNNCELEGIIDCYLPFTPSEVTIGTQTWMSANLDVDDGDTGIYAYDDDESNVVTYGRLYKWDAAVRVAASIDGWHLPTDDEWKELESTIGTDPALIDLQGDRGNKGGTLKEIGTTYWNTPNIGATNSNNFNGRGAGYRTSSYINFKNWCKFWTNTPVSGYTGLLSIMRGLSWGNDGIRRTNTPSSECNVNNGYSVRLIKD